MRLRMTRCVWRRNLSPFGLACFARWLRYRGSTYPEYVVAPAALPTLKSRFVNNPRRTCGRSPSTGRILFSPGLGHARVVFFWKGLYGDMCVPPR
jgi:hypothetical protein